MRIGSVGIMHRERIRAILAATDAFSADEIIVALELFDLAARAEPASVAGGAEDALVDYEVAGAFDGETLVGYICFGVTPAAVGTYDLYWLAVDPAAQGQGAGRALTRWVANEIGKRGARLLIVETSSRQEYAGARAFYTRSGCTEVARLRDFYAPADDRILLTIRLTAQEHGAATQ